MPMATNPTPIMNFRNILVVMVFPLSSCRDKGSTQGQFFDNIYTELGQGMLSISGLHINYKITGNSSGCLLILHGWGGSLLSWAKVQELLSQNGFRVIALDLPGFGKSQPPQEVWGVEEYAQFVLEFAEEIGLGKFILLGHSFGGQIATYIAAHYPEKLEKLILVSPAAIRREPGMKTKLLGGVAKIGNVFISLIPISSLRKVVRKVFYKVIGKRDYAKAQGIMRDIFRKVTRQDMSPLFSKISTPTLLVWGEKDDYVPFSDAAILNKEIKNSKLITFPGVKHSPHLEVPEKLSNFILEFLKKP